MGRTICENCGTVARCCKVIINMGHIKFMTTFAKCIGRNSSAAEIEEGFLAKRVFCFCDKCIPLLQAG